MVQEAAATAAAEKGAAADTAAAGENIVGKARWRQGYSFTRTGWKILVWESWGIGDSRRRRLQLKVAAAAAHSLLQPHAQAIVLGLGLDVLATLNWTACLKCNAAM